jgi:PTHB1 N-terminus
MSLFSLRELWKGSVSSEEVFAPGGLVVANVDNSLDGNGTSRSHSSTPQTPQPRPPGPSCSADKVVTGSLHGVLRIYSPAGRGATNVDAESLMLEQDLGAPILQLAVGRLQVCVGCGWGWGVEGAVWGGGGRGRAAGDVGGALRAGAREAWRWWCCTRERWWCCGCWRRARRRRTR